MSENIRSLSKLIVTSSEWPTKSASVLLKISIRKEDSKFTASLIAKDDTGFGYGIEYHEASLSDAATKYDLLLNNYFHGIQIPVTQSWFITNGFKPI